MSSFFYPLIHSLLKLNFYPIQLENIKIWTISNEKGKKEILNEIANNKKLVN